MRILAVTSKAFDSYGILGPLEITFDPNEYKDSEALHHFLTQYNPGDTYTVNFRNIEE
jgi:hypothetical protein